MSAEAEPGADSPVMIDRETSAMFEMNTPLEYADLMYVDGKMPEVGQVVEMVCTFAKDGTRWYRLRVVQ